MTVELIAVLSIAALAIIAGFGWLWAFVREIQRDLNTLREKVAAMNEKIDRGGPASASWFLSQIDLPRRRRYPAVPR